MQKSTYLKDYKSSNFEIKLVELDINLDDDITIVKSKMFISGRFKNQTLILMGSQLKLRSVSINGNLTTDFIQNNINLILNTVPKEFILEIIVIIKPQENTSLMGLYKSKDMYCTQCEPNGFRKITYYLDRPDIMSQFIVTIHADKKRYPILLSNGNKINQGDESNGRHFVTWKDFVKKPCYLFALIAGDLIALEDHFLTMYNRLVTLKLYVERENIEKTAYAMSALKKSMRWDEVKYGLEYDLDIYMMVAINDFNMGAMENKGLNIFNSNSILVSSDTATDQDYKYVDSVVAHEYFHNWSGNRVTCRDWFQLSLKEGLTVFREQQYMKDITNFPITRIEQAKNIMTQQFMEDAGPLVHSVQPDSYIEINNFYTSTVYDKGSEIIHMLCNLIGYKKFRVGTDLYFSKFDGKAITIDDFIAVMEEASGLSLKQFKKWYSQAGTNEVQIKEYYKKKDNIYILLLKQNIINASKKNNKQQLMHIPIKLGLLDSKGTDIPIKNDIIYLTKSSQKFKFYNIPEKPVLSILRDFSAPIILKRKNNFKELAFLFTHDTNDFSRWHAGQQLYEAICFSLEKLPILLCSVKHILENNTINHALKAELLTLPSFNKLILFHNPADPDEIYQSKKQMLFQLNQELSDLIFKVYNNTTSFLSHSYKYISDDVGTRKLKNLMLQYLLQNPTQDMINLAVQQYNNANNMTDSIGALKAISNLDCIERIQLFNNFYDKWIDHPLVINKWLAIQACSDIPNALQHVKKIMQYNVFDIHNPNKVYALIENFCIDNHKHFHNNNGEGYKFLADNVIELNSLNAQVAARILVPLTEWYKFVPQRKDLMITELHRIRKLNNLSSDVYEILLKSLQ